MDMFKRILAILALLSMLVFVVAVLVLLATGSLAANPGWIYGPMTCFLMFGLTSLLINWLMKRAAEARRKQEEGHE